MKLHEDTKNLLLAYTGVIPGMMAISQIPSLESLGIGITIFVAPLIIGKGVIDNTKDGKIQKSVH